jgi:hypothetical protein
MKDKKRRADASWRVYLQLLFKANGLEWNDPTDTEIEGVIKAIRKARGEQGGANV